MCSSKNELLKRYAQIEHSLLHKEKFGQWIDILQKAYGIQVADTIHSEWNFPKDDKQKMTPEQTLPHNCRWWDKVFATEKTGYGIRLLENGTFRDGFFYVVDWRGSNILHRAAGTDMYPRTTHNVNL